MVRVFVFEPWWENLIFSDPAESTAGFPGVVCGADMISPPWMRGYSASMKPNGLYTEPLELRI
jgi:hypothetical protein